MTHVCKFALRLISTACLLAASAYAAAQNGGDFPLAISSDGQLIVSASGEPFLINGATPWSLAVVPTKAEVQSYLDDRAAKGFNAITMNAIERQFGGPGNSDGDQPFLSAGDFSTPNDAYFNHVEWIVAEAAAREMVVFLTPAYLGFQCGNEGWCNEVKNNSKPTLREYGRYMGARFVTHPNIVWVHGGDVDAAAYSALDEVNEIVAGIKETDTVHLHTAHCGPGDSALDCYDEPWLDINTTYVRDCTSVATATRTDDQRSRQMPFFFFEGLYENEGASQVCLRGQAYTPVLGGAVGHSFGNRPIWLFDGGWQQALNSAGAADMQHVRDLFESRNWPRLVPDRNEIVVTSGRGDIGSSNYASAAVAADNSSIMLYVPGDRQVAVDTTVLGGDSIKAWRFDPDTGGATDLGTFSESTSQVFDGDGLRDWLLVIDDASLQLPAPGNAGTGPVDTVPPEVSAVTTETGNPNLVTITFTEPVDTTSAELASNYSISPIVSINAATQTTDFEVVTLATDVLAENVNYTITVSNVSDRATPANLIDQNNTGTFTYDAGDATGGPENYIWGQLNNGSLVYIDSTTVFASLPSRSVGQQYLQTASVDNMASGSPFLTFDVSVDSRVTVGFDRSIGSIPGWLSGWTRSSDTIETGPAVGLSENTFELYEQDYNAGTVELGGNELGGEMYTVFVTTLPSQPEPPPSTTTSSGSGSISVTLLLLLSIFGAARAERARRYLHGNT